MMLLMVRLEALYTESIMHKLVVDRDHSSRSILIETTHLILSLVLSALSQRLVLARHRFDLEWSVSTSVLLEPVLAGKTSFVVVLFSFSPISICAVSLLRDAMRQCPRARTSASGGAAAATTPHHNQPFHTNTRPERVDIMLQLVDRARPAKLQPVQTRPVHLLAESRSDFHWIHTAAACRACGAGGRAGKPL